MSKIDWRRAYRAQTQAKERRDEEMLDTTPGWYKDMLAAQGMETDDLKERYELLEELNDKYKELNEIQSRRILYLESCFDALGVWVKEVT